jgi:hypothetical protein
MTIQEVTILPKKGQRKPPSVQMKSNLKDVAFEEDGAFFQPNVNSFKSNDLCYV